MGKIEGKVYKIKDNESWKEFFATFKSKEDLFKYIIESKRVSVNVNEVLLNGKTPRVSVYTDKLYKKMKKEMEK
jgi:hypothetical protein